MDNFLDKFDRLESEGEFSEARDYFFCTLSNEPVALCELLRERRPVFRFHSRNPGNPELQNSNIDLSPVGEGHAYLLTRSEDVRYALENFSMHSYRLDEDRYFLSVDDEARHEALRNLSTRSMMGVPEKMKVLWAEEAVEEAWDLQYQDTSRWNSSGCPGKFLLDVEEFSREATLRFCGRFYGLPREQIVAGEFRKWTADAFEQFIWKLFGRHFFDSPNHSEAIPNLAKVAARALASANTENRVTFTDHLVYNNSRTYDKQTGELALSGKDLVSNLIGGFQGFIDNAVSCTCLVVSALLNENSSRGGDTLKFTDLRNLDHAGTKTILREVLRQNPPGPWLPRVGDLQQLPGYSKITNAESGGNASCILAVGSAMADPAASKPYRKSTRPDAITCDKSRYGSDEDLSFGYGFHRCVGLSLSDTVLSCILKRISTLDNPKELSVPQKKWTWILTSYEVCAESDPVTLAPRWPDKLRPDQIQLVPPVKTGQRSSVQGRGLASTLEPSTSSDLRSVPPGDLASLSSSEFIYLSDQQIGNLTDSQIKLLTEEHVACLRSRINLLSPEQLVLLSESALRGLRRKEAGDVSFVTILDAPLVAALLTVRSKDLEDDIMRELSRQASRYKICGIAGSTQPRPNTFSLWSASMDTDKIESYTSWPGLTDKSWTARHLPAAETLAEHSKKIVANKSAEDTDSIASLFRCPSDRAQIESTHTNVLFTWFAQWVSDSFLRTNLDDRRRNHSNHQIDLCQLYGLNEVTTRMLREHSGGRLLSERDSSGEEYMPRLFDDVGKTRNGFRDLPYMANGSLHRKLQEISSGDTRREHMFATALMGGNVTFGYAAISTLFLREHNRICAQLEKQDETHGWGDERLFQTARMILTVILIKIVIADYINHIAAPESIKKTYVFDQSYAEQQAWYREPRIALEFNLLYRWHSMVPSVYTIDSKDYAFEDYRMNNEPLVESGLATILNAASKQRAGRPGLFNTIPELVGAEYAAMKMSRSFHVGSFNDYRRHFSLPSIMNFDDVTVDEKVQGALKQRYGDTSKIELLVGLYAEDPFFGSTLFGSLMTTMLGFDAFTQTLTNPLLAKNVFNEKTFTSWGLAEIEHTESLNDLVRRNVARPETVEGVSFKLHRG